MSYTVVPTTESTNSSLHQVMSRYELQRYINGSIYTEFIHRGSIQSYVHNVLALIILFFIFVWRFAQIDELIFPAWVDSVHHTLLVRILLEQNRVPLSWEPYLPETPFYYHFGFHITAAIYAKIFELTELNLSQAVLTVGQVWQVACAFGIYLLGLTIWRNSQKALIALLLIGFVSQMPAYYVTWGRYTLLAGVTLMILAMSAALKKRFIILCLLIVATAITHYYALFLLFLFLGIVYLLSSKHRSVIGAGCTTGLLIISPWLWRVLYYGRQYVSVAPNKPNSVTNSENLSNLLGPTHNYILLTLGIIGLTYVLLRLISERKLNNMGLVSISLFALLLIGLMGPWMIGPFRPDHAVIVLFVPMILLAVEAVWLLQRPIFIWGYVAILVIYGAWETREIINPETVFVTSEDLSAIEWVDENTSKDAIFLIDVEPWFGIWRGRDGGWWLMPLTGRMTTIPPIVYTWSDIDVIQQLNFIAEETISLEHDSSVDYCIKLLGLINFTESSYYYTRSKEPKECSKLTLVHNVANEVYIYRYRAIEKHFSNHTTEPNVADE